MLTGKIALVTGASRGIGAAIAKKLASQGATVIVNYNGSKQQAEKTVEEILEQGGIAEAIQCNVADEQESVTMIKEILEKYKRVDILVNNAGITKDNLLMRMTEQEFEDVININLKGAFHMMKSLSRSFVKQRSGKIINISSVSGVMGNAGQANYAASKAGLIGMTKSIARELASRSICVNAIAPGFIDTEMTKSMPEDTQDSLKNMIPLGRMGRAEEVANLALFLASAQSDYITGQVISIDGGLHI